MVFMVTAIGRTLGNLFFGAVLETHVNGLILAFGVMLLGLLPLAALLEGTRGTRSDPPGSNPSAE